MENETIEQKQPNIDKELKLDKDQKFAAKVLKKYADYMKQDAIER